MVRSSGLEPMLIAEVWELCWLEEGPPGKIESGERESEEELEDRSSMREGEWGTIGRTVEEARGSGRLHAVGNPARKNRERRS